MRPSKRQRRKFHVIEVKKKTKQTWMTGKFLAYMLNVYERIVCKERTCQWKIITQRTRKIQSLTDIDIDQYIQADLQWTESAQKLSSRSFTCLSTCLNPNAFFFIFVASLTCSFRFVCYSFRFFFFFFFVIIIILNTFGDTNEKKKTNVDLV